MSIGRLLQEFRPLFRLLDAPLRGTPALYSRAFDPDPFFTSPSTVHPTLDLMEEGDNYVVEADLPGVKKDNVDITVGDGGHSVTIQGRTISRRPGNSSESESTAETGSATQGQVTIKAEPGVVNSETPSHQLTTERLYSGTSSFTRTVWLPRPVDASKVTAKLADGVLTLKAPRLEDKEAIKINVD